MTAEQSVAFLVFSLVAAITPGVRTEYSTRRKSADKCDVVEALVAHAYGHRTLAPEGLARSFCDGLSIRYAQWALASEHAQLMAEGDHFQSQRGAATKAEGQHRKNGRYERNHVGDATAIDAATPCFLCFICDWDRVRNAARAAATTLRSDRAMKVRLFLNGRNRQ